MQSTALLRDTTSDDVAATSVRDTAICFVVVATLFYLYSRYTSVPLIHGDEAGYLMHAAALAGHATDAYSSYYPGYSLPITIAFLFGGEPVEIFHRIQAINALLWGGAAGVLLALVRMLEPGCSRATAFAVVAVTLSYPAFAVFGSLSMSENLFAPATITLAWMLMRQARTLSWAAVAGAGVIAGLLMLTHPKGMLVMLAAMLAMLEPVRRQASRVLPRVAMFLVVGVGVWLALSGPLDAYLRATLNAEAVADLQHYPGLKDIIEDFLRIFTWEGFLRAVAVASGQIAYLVAGSLGLAAVGTWICASRGLSRQTRDDERVLFLFVIASVMLVYGFSVFFMKDGPRADHLMYGRYTESVVAPLLLIGALSLPMRKALALAAGAVVVLGVVVLLTEGNASGDSVVVVNITAVDAARRWFGGDLHVAGVLSVGVMAIALLCMMRTRKAVLAVLLVANVAGAIEVAHYFLGPGSRYRAKQTQLVDLVKAQYPPVACVNMDMRNMTPWQMNNYQFHMLPLRVAAVEADDPFVCGDYLVSALERMPEQYADAVAVAREFDAPEQLWLRGRALQAWIDTRPTLDVPENGLALGSTEAFGVPGLAAGWHGVEPWGVWSGERGLLVVRSPAQDRAALRLEFNILATEQVPRTVTLSCHGHALAKSTHRASGGTAIEVPRADLVAAGCFDTAQFGLSILTEPAVSPKALGMGEDGRVLGIGLQRVRWMPGG